MTIDLSSNYRSVQQRIADAAARAGRDLDEITLVAVSKTRAAESVLAAHALGMRHFGENRVEEALEKIPLVQKQLTNHPSTSLKTSPTIEQSNITWHLVGHLQGRKVKEAAYLFDLVHSIDSVALAKRLNDRVGVNGKTMPILLEVNVSGEPSKYGFAPAPRDSFFAAVRDILAMPHLDLKGLMTIAPIVTRADDARPYFRALRELRDELRGLFPERAWSHLSMGMTDDFEAAIAEGATIVRIGRAIFGERH